MDKRLKELKRQRDELNAEIKRVEIEQYTIANAELVGKYFKKDDTYGVIEKVPSEYWVICKTFCVDNDGIYATTREDVFTNNSSFEIIEESEFLDKLKYAKQTFGEIFK